MSSAETTEGQVKWPATVAIIPAHNEARFVGSVVLQALQHVDTAIVVDDGSTDDTAAIAEAAGARVVRHPQNMGKGPRSTAVSVRRESCDPRSWSSWTAMGSIARGRSPRWSHRSETAEPTWWWAPAS